MAELNERGDKGRTEPVDMSHPYPCCYYCEGERVTAITGRYALPIPTVMIVCPSCGNKRCPMASDHRLVCTRSNDPGQPGSVYTGRLLTIPDTVSPPSFTPEADQSGGTKEPSMAPEPEAGERGRDEPVIKGHPKSCACAGRGWFHEHDHRADCIYDECVGCARRTVPCDEVQP